MSQVQRQQLTVATEQAVLIGVILSGDYVDERDPLGELRALAETAGANVVGQLVQRRGKPVAGTYLGKGKVEEVADLIRRTQATVAIFDNDLSPAQVRNLEQATSCKIVDRSELILDIFANRASTHAARLQVEIAQLEYTYPRLRAMWDHLGQVVGGAPVGIGTRGPGEQQLEIDRRLVQNRLTKLRHELEEVQQRKSREVAQRNLNYYTVGLVGYTNAGKSTLFNKLTDGGAFSHSKLFATLSTRIERWELGGGNAAMLSDTVGFIRNLPHHLVASFRSTLEETIFANQIVIVLDVSDPHASMQLDTVQTTLKEIGACNQPRLIALNKIDQLGSRRDLDVWLNRHPDAIPISATTGEGVDGLSETVLEKYLGHVREVRISLPSSDSKSILFIERRTTVLDRSYNGMNVEFTVKIGRRQVDQLLAYGGSILINGMNPHTALEEIWPNGEPAGPPRVPPHRIHTFSKPS